MRTVLLNRSFRFAILAPLLVLIVVTVSAFFYGSLYEERAQLTDRIQQLQRVSLLAEREAIQQQTSALSQALNLIEDDHALQQAFSARDRQNLFLLAEPIYQKLREFSHLTHFYFHTPERVAFLRVHQPDRFGGTVDRITLKKAVSEQSLQSGVELGPIGTFTLRVVKPWYVDNKLLGYLEVGLESQALIEASQHVSGLHSVIQLDKQFLDPNGWEDGMALLKRSSDWDRLPASVIAYQSLDNIPDAFLLRDYAAAGERIEFGGRDYFAMSRSLNDVADRSVGRLLNLYDITNAVQRARQTALLVASLTGSLGMAVLAFFYVWTGRIGRRLHTQQQAIVDAHQKREDLQARHLVELEREIGARKYAESILAESNASFRHMLTKSPAVIYISQVDGDYKISFISENVSEALGYEPEVLIQDPASRTRYMHPDDRVRFLEELKSAVESEDSWDCEYRVKAKDGRYRWLHDGMRLLRDDVNGQPKEIVGYWIDITEQKESESASFNAQQRLGLYFEQTPMAVIEWNMAFEVVAWNPGAENLFGYSAGEVKGKRPFGLIVPEDEQAEVSTVWQTLIDQKGGFRSSNTNITREGERIECEWYNTVLRDQGGVVIGGISLAEDITDRKRSEDQLKHSEARYRNLLESNPLMCFTLDPLGTIIYVNREGANQLGYTEEELCGQSVFVLFSDELHEQVREKLERCLNEPDQIHSWEIKKQRKDDSSIWANETAMVMREGGERLF